MLKATNPATGRTIQAYEALTDPQIEDRLTAAHHATLPWQQKTFQERAAVLRALAIQLRHQKSQLTTLMAEEMGKPVKEGGPEVEKAAWCAEHYAEFAEQYLTDEILPSDANFSYVCYQPLGTILGILPWNAPVWLAFRFMAPSLMAGNTCVMKHDPNVPGCALALEYAFAAVAQQMDVPDLMVNLPIETHRVVPVIQDSRINGVTFTGSSEAGAKVASLAAGALKRTVLELGGSDPCVILGDADLDKAADVAVLSRCINAGQSCIAAKRIIVDDAVYDDFVGRLQHRLERLRVGDPLSPETDIGPLARADLRENLHRQVEETLEAGARCLMGGELPSGSGYFYPVTLLTEVEPGMTAFREETFGPVMCVTRARSVDHAIELANDTYYGLGAAVWTRDTAVAKKMAMAIQSGQIAINGIVKTDPRLPSGGTKRSGYGRELGPHGIREFVNAKQIWQA